MTYDTVPCSVMSLMASVGGTRNALEWNAKVAVVHTNVSDYWMIAYSGGQIGLFYPQGSTTSV